MRKTIIAVASALAVLAVPSAAMAADTPVQYNGQGMSGGAPNNQPVPANDAGTGHFANWGDENNTYDAGEGYLVWVLSANGATSAKITIGETTYPMVKFGGNFKAATPFVTGDALMGATATYEGKAKGNIHLTVSHGSIVFDTNIPSGTVLDEKTGTGHTDIRGDQFTMTETFTGRTWWTAIDMPIRERISVRVSTRNVAAEEIIGNNTGEVVGYEFTGPGAYIKFGTLQVTGTLMPSGTVNYGHYNWDGGSVGADATNEYSDLMVDGTPLPNTPEAPSEAPAL